MEAVLLELLHRLEAIERVHGEVSDSAVRDTLHGAVFRGFIQPETDYRVADRFAMFTEEGDKIVHDTMVWFVAAANQAAEQEKLDTPEKRLIAFQNPDIRTATNDTGDFFGSITLAEFEQFFKKD